MSAAQLFEREILIVSGKGGTGKSTLAAALAVAAFRTGRRVLLAEVEGRGEVTRTLGVPDPGFDERGTPLGPSVVSIRPNEAALEYLHLFFGADRVTRRLLRSGFLDQVVRGAPGFRDLLTCGKLYEIARVRRTNPRDRGRPTYDLIVVDAPPTGQIVPFLSAAATYADLIRVGRMRRQASAIARLLRERAGVVLVAVPEEMAVAETLDAVPAVARTGVKVVGVVANRCVAPVIPAGARRSFPRLSAAGLVDAATGAGLALEEPMAKALLEEAAAGEARHRLQQGFVADLRRAARDLLILPDVPGSGGPALVQQLAGELVPGGPAGPADPVPSRVRISAAPVVTTSLGPHLDGARVVVICGSGGVGKTTISAALAVHLAEEGRRTALLTVDPARRLATALRLPLVPGERVEIRVARGRRLEAQQLDTQRTFDELIRRHAGSADSRDRILSNPFYRRIADTLAGTHEYMAMEKLYELVGEEDHEAIVVDTPPTRSALSFLDAPARLTDFLGGRALRLLLWPTARAGRLTLGVARVGAAAFARTVGHLVGAEVLADVVEFLSAFEGMYGGFADRAGQVLDLLRSKECAFIVVTSPTASSVEEAGYFVDRLAEGGMRAAAVVANRWHHTAAMMPAAAVRVAALLADGDADERAAAAAIAEGVRRQPQRAAETATMAAFCAAHPEVPVVAVPDLAGDVHDVPGLRRVAASLFGDPPSRSASRSAGRGIRR